jgi:hypothetical protein
MRDSNGMANEDFPAGLRQFIEHHIESVAQLEALLLMRSDPQRQWAAGELAKALYIPEEAADALLSDLARRGFVGSGQPPTPGYTYQARDNESDQMIAELEAMYRERRVAVTSLIYSKPLNKVQTFADAFRFGKENP